MERERKPKVNVLCVDDRPDGLLALQAVLSCDEYNLVLASSGEEALRHFLRDDFAVVLLDVQMPGMNGFECAQRMRKAEGRHKTPIIFVTAINFEDRYVHAGYEAGAVDYIFKPFDTTILRSKVQVFVELYRMNQEVQRHASLLQDAERKDRERMLAELELENLRRYQGLADAIPHIVWKAKTPGVMDYFNNMWTEFTGLTLEQSSGFGWQSMIHQQDLTPLMEAWTAAAKPGIAFESEVRIRNKVDGSYRWHIVRAVPQFSRIGLLTDWVGTSTDIHDRKLVEEERQRLLELETTARIAAERAVMNRKETEEALMQAKEAAEGASRAKSHLLANMSHEIRTPLGVILGYADLLRDPTLPDTERAKCLDTIVRNGQQLAKLVDDILDLSKAEAGKLDVEIVPFSLKGLLTEIFATFEAKAQEKGVQLDFHIDPRVPNDVATDPTRIRQILMNLLGNSLKFTETGYVRLKVSRSDAAAESANQCSLCFDVEDTGVGISYDHQGHLFQEFMQADASTTRKYGGTGLGLALSRKLARILGGDLVLLRSAEQSGSMFTFNVKAQVIDKKPLDQRQGARGQPGFASKLAGLSILLVDDAPDNQFLVSRLLQKAGAKVSIAGDGHEAVAAATAALHDIILMDIQMPGMDGYEATETLRGQGFKRPIIALTAHAMKGEREKCLARGFNDHLTKPIDCMVLLDMILRYTRGDLAGTVVTRPASHSVVN